MKIITRQKQASDSRLWEQMKNGNEHALEILFKRHYPMLYDYGIKLANNQEFVKDSIQEVFAYIWEKRETLSAIDSVPPYLMISMRRKLFDFIKKENRQNDSYQYLEYTFPQSTFSTEELWIINEEEEERKKTLKTALSKIPPRMSEALYLKKFSGLSYKEIASIMNVSPQVARNYVSEAFQRLRSILNSSNLSS